MSAHLLKCLLLVPLLMATLPAVAQDEPVVQPLDVDDAAMNGEATDEAMSEEPHKKPSELFDGSQSPEYDFGKPIKVYYEKKGTRDRKGKKGWWWGLSKGTYWFIEPINPRRELEAPDREPLEIIEESELKGISDEKTTFKYIPGQTNWGQLSLATVGSSIFQKEQQVTDVLKQMRREEREEELAAAPAPVTEKPAVAAPAAPRTPVAAPPAAVPAPAEVPGGAVDQVKNMPDLYKWIIGGVAILIILFFFLR